MAYMPGSGLQCAVPFLKVALSSAATAQDSGSEISQVMKQGHVGRSDPRWGDAGPAMQRLELC